MLRQALDTESGLRERERRFDRADRLLAGMSLLAAVDLDRKIGNHPAGEFRVGVQRPEPSLYRISISDTVPVPHELLVTVVYRPAEVTP